MLESTKREKAMSDTCETVFIENKNHLTGYVEINKSDLGKEDKELTQKQVDALNKKNAAKEG